jgi:hypothetical protein
MQAPEALPQLLDTLTVKRVYSEPYREDGVTIITAAAVQGGGGGLRYSATEGRGGMGVRARPVGAYVITNGRVVWKPAFDLSRIILRGQLVAMTALLVFGLLLRRSRRADHYR